MTVLFPTFTNLLQRVKHLLATDTRDIWQRFADAIEADDARYQERLKASKFEDFNFFYRTFI